MSGLVDYELSDNESDNENNESNLLLVDYMSDGEEKRNEYSLRENVLKRKDLDDLSKEDIIAR
jgi:hypothetical protein